MAGETEEGVDHLLQSLAVAEEHDLESRIIGAYSMLGSGLGEMYDLERSERSLRDHIRFASEREVDASYTRSWLALVHVYRGRWAEGTDLAHRVLREPGGWIARISALIALGRVRARRGDPGAAAPLEEALELSLAGGLDSWPGWLAEPYRLQLEGAAEEAAAAWRERHCPYEAARALAESDDAD